MSLLKKEARMNHMVPRGLEPRTLRLLAVRSNQLSYETNVKEFMCCLHIWAACCLSMKYPIAKRKNRMKDCEMGGCLSRRDFEEIAHPQSFRNTFTLCVLSTPCLLLSRGESGWCSDWTSTPGAWRHAGAQFPLPGATLV